MCLFSAQTNNIVGWKDSAATCPNYRLHTLTRLYPNKGVMSAVSTLYDVQDPQLMLSAFTSDQYVVSIPCKTQSSASAVRGNSSILVS